MLKIAAVIFLTLRTCNPSVVFTRQPDVQVTYGDEGPREYFAPIAEQLARGKITPKHETQPMVGPLTHGSIPDERSEGGENEKKSSEKVSPNASDLENEDGTVVEVLHQPEVSGAPVVAGEESTYRAAQKSERTKKQQGEDDEGKGGKNREDISGIQAKNRNYSHDAHPAPRGAVSVVDQGSTQGVKTVSKRSVDERGKEISQQQASGQYESYVALPLRNGMSEREVSRPSEVAVDNAGEPSSLRESVPKGNGTSRKRYAILLSAGLSVVFS
ncbi:uncharacterized protein TEOVI_000495400 [Trypanosoma equiperdum]|uniref:Expression site-associated gene 9 (ESAG9) protein n=1 Tax=Trypanosoma equiperdum TaxID=5694 RepID=A0A1G4I9K8_TRYEQ|nr:hypothetical protein, conserved [Trypanosoma equiperdum]